MQIRNPSAISSEVKELIEKARAGKLAPNEFLGRTFGISNLGVYAVDQFAAIIILPQAGMLAVSRGNKGVNQQNKKDKRVDFHQQKGTKLMLSNLFLFFLQ